MGVVLKAFTLKLTKPGTPLRTWIQMPANINVIQENLLRDAKGTKGAETIWSRFSLLPEYLQCYLCDFLKDLPPPSSQSSIIGPTLLSIGLDKQRRRRAIERLKSLTPFYGHPSSSGHITIVVAWTRGRSDHGSGRPLSKIHPKPLIHSPTSYKVPRQLTKPLSHERLRPIVELIQEDYPFTNRESFKPRQRPHFQYPSIVRDNRSSNHKQSTQEADTLRLARAGNRKTGRDSRPEDFQRVSRSDDPAVDSRRRNDEELLALDQRNQSLPLSCEEQHTRGLIEYGVIGSGHSEQDQRTSVVANRNDSPGNTSSAELLRKRSQPRKKRYSTNTSEYLRNERKLARDNEIKLEKRKIDLECHLRLQE